MNDQSTIGSAKMGTIGSVLTILFVNISTGEIIKTAIMAAIGAIVGFFISTVLKFLLAKWHK